MIWLHLLAVAPPVDPLSGGVAVAALTFAGGVIRFMSGREAVAVARGDRLENTLINTMVPTINENTAATREMLSAMQQLRHERDIAQALAQRGPQP